MWVPHWPLVDVPCKITYFPIESWASERAARLSQNILPLLFLQILSARIFFWVARFFKFLQDIILISGNRYYVMNLVLAGRTRETLSGPQVRPTPPIVQSRRRPAWSSCSDIWARHQIVRDVSSFVFFLLISFTMSEVKVQVFTDFDGTLSLDGKLPFRNRKHKHRVVLGFSLSSGINRYWSYVDRRSPFSWPRAPSWVGTLDPYR